MRIRFRTLDEMIHFTGSTFRSYGKHWNSHGEMDYLLGWEPEDKLIQEQLQRVFRENKMRKIVLRRIGGPTLNDYGWNIEKWMLLDMDSQKKEGTKTMIKSGYKEET